MCCDTVPAEFLIRIIDIKNGSQKFVKEELEEEEIVTNEKSRRD